MSAYGGPRRKLVIAFDVGTTFSGVSYAVLDPGQVPKVQGVNRFPGQENLAGDAKIPSVLYYDHHGEVRAVGAEAQLPGTIVQAEDEGWIFVEWFKLHLRPESLDAHDLNKHRIPCLPRGKGVVDVFGDFMRYLLDCARRYIMDTQMNGRSLWSSLQDEIEFVLSHPNGWEGAQQQRMRRAAIAGGLIRDTHSGHSRIHFVTEGEASLQYCIRNNLGLDKFGRSGKRVTVIDAGGGTIDISSYAVATIKPLSVEEITNPDCLLQGSVAVNTRAYIYLQTLLRNSQYGNDDDLKAMCDSFDKTTKPTFKDPTESAYIRFGSMRCNDPAVSIRRGQLMITGSAMTSLFEPSITAILNAVSGQRRASSRQIDVVFLVGGFAASPWLHRRLREGLQKDGIELCRPDSHTSKAVAEGAVSYYLERNVSLRVSRLTYGTEVCQEFDLYDEEHVRRRHMMMTRPSGSIAIPGAFSVILAKGTPLRENDEISVSYTREAEFPSTLNYVVDEIECYRGPNQAPCWKDVEASDFSIICLVRADMSGVRKTPQVGKYGKIYYKQSFKIILLCGLTELKAQISWIENGVEKRGPAEIVYDID